MLRLPWRRVALRPARVCAILLLALLCPASVVVSPLHARLQEAKKFALCTEEQREGDGPCGGGGGGGGPAGEENKVFRFFREMDQEPFINADPGSFGVVPASGEYVRQEVDLRLPGRGFDFVLSRTYRSRARITTVLGDGWNFTYNEKMIHHPLDGIVEWVRGDSWSDVFTWNPLKGWESFTGFYGLLKEPVAQAFPYRARFALRTPEGMIRYYRDNGDLLAMVDRNGNSMEFHYNDDGRLQRVIDTMGRAVEFAYAGGSGLLQTVTDPLGRVISYAYRNGRLVGVTSPWVALAEGAAPRRLTTTYTYSGSRHALLEGNLTSITDARGRTWLTVRYGENEFVSGGEPAPDFDRVVSLQRGRQDPGAPAMSYSYQQLALHPNDLQGASRRTSITGRRGNTNQRDYNRRNMLIARRELNNPDIPDGDDRESVTTFQYADGSGRLLRIIHPELSETRYFYDGNTSFCPDCGEGIPDSYRGGNITRIVEVAGPRGDGHGNSAADRVTDMTYESIFNQESSRTDPAGHTWRRRFDYEELDCDGPEHSDLLAYAERWSLDLAGPQAPLCGHGDLNYDFELGGGAGNMVRAQDPGTRLADGRMGPIPATVFHYNHHGQVVKKVDPEGFVDHLFYYPEARPHDGITLTPAPQERELDQDTGGYLRRLIQDAADEVLGRTAAALPEPVRLQADYVYDGAGERIQLTDPRGVIHTTLRNELGWPLRLTLAAAVAGEPRGEPGLQPLHRSIRLAYDENFNVIERRTASGSTTPGVGERLITQQFNLLNQPVSIITRSEPDDGSPAISWFTYDAAENQVMEISGEGRVTRHEYDDRGRLFRTRRFAAMLDDPPGDGFTVPPLDDLHDQVVELRFDLHGSVVARRDRQAGDGGLTPRGDEQRSDYNGFDEQVATRDEACSRQLISRDARGLETTREIYGPTGGPTPLAAMECAPSYPLLARRELRRDALGRVTMTLDDDFTHGPDPLVEREPNPHGPQRVATLIYNLRGDLKRIADGRGRTHLFTYDGAGRMIFRRLGEALQVDGPVAMRQETELRYNGDGRVSHWSIAEPGSQEGDGAQEGSFSYDAAGGLVSSSQMAAGEAITETLERNSAGKVIRHVGATGAETAYSLDGLGRVKAVEARVTAADGSPDASFANPDGRIRWTYDYSPDGLLRARTDDRGQASTWAYDGVGRVVSATYPDGRRWQTDHDPEGNPLSIQVRGPQESGTDAAPLVYNMEYDALNRLTRRTATLLPSAGLAATPSLSREHDALGRLTRIVSEAGESGRQVEVRRTYDSLGRLVAEEQSFLGVTHTLTAAHDNEGFRQELHLAGAGGVEMTTFFTADGMGRLARVDAPGRVTAEYGYSGSGREMTRDLTLPGGEGGAPGYGLQRSTRYDAAGRRNGLVYLDAGTGEEKAGFHRVLDPAGLPVSRRTTHLQGGPAGEQDQGLLLEHDSMGRLRRSAAGALSGSSLEPVIETPTDQWEFVFDGAGNRAQVTRNEEVRRHGADAMNFYEVVDARLDETGVWGGGTLQEKDLLGNLRREEAEGMAILYSHDAYGRLAGIHKEVAATGQVLPVASFTYDGLGRRLETDLEGGERRTWIYDDWRVVAEYGYAPGPLRDDPAAPADLLKALNVHGRALDEVLYAERDLDGLPGLETALIPVTDLQGSTERLLDNQGDVVEVYTYEPFGLRRITGAAGPLAASAQDYRFGYTGQRHELFLSANRHLIHMRHRMYDPDRGRYLEPDPLGAGDDANLYAYVGNSPYRASDPLGLFAVSGGVDGFASGLTRHLAAGTGFTLMPGWQGGAVGLGRSVWRAAASHWKAVSQREQNEDSQYELHLRRVMNSMRDAREKAEAGATSMVLAARISGDEPPPPSCPPGFLDCVTVSAGRPDRHLLYLLDAEASRLAGEEERIGDAQQDLARHQAAESYEIGFSAEAVPFFFGFGFKLGVIVDSMGNFGVIVGGRSQACCGLGFSYGAYGSSSDGSMFMQRGNSISVSAAVATPWGGASYSHAAGNDSVTVSLRGPSLLISAGVETTRQGIVAMSGTPPQAPPPAVRRPPGLYRRD